MTVKFLWSNREKPHALTLRWLKVWVKRMIQSKLLITLMMRRSYLSIRGANIEKLVIISPSQIHGSVNRLSIAEKSFIGVDVQMTLHESITIQDRVVVNDHVKLLTGSHDCQSTTWDLIARPILIKRYAWIAMNALILPGVTIGEGAVVGAGAVVSKDVPDYMIVAGNPARVVGERSRSLDYNPVALCSAFEAWVGKENEQMKPSTRVKDC